MTNFNAFQVQPGDRFEVEIAPPGRPRQTVNVTVDTVQPHTVNWDIMQFFVTCDVPVTVWSEDDIRDGFCICHNHKGNNHPVRIIRAII